MPKEPRKVGVIDGRFYPCPKKHVCVSTQSDKNDEIHYIEPIPFRETKQEAMEKILKIVNSMSRTKILEKSENYIHALFTTALLRFKDDVEFYFDDSEKLIHFKSQSRIGGYDWETNKKRMNTIKDYYLKS